MRWPTTLVKGKYYPKNEDWYDNADKRHDGSDIAEEKSKRELPSPLYKVAAYSSSFRLGLRLLNSINDKPFFEVAKELFKKIQARKNPGLTSASLRSTASNSWPNVETSQEQRFGPLVCVCGADPTDSHFFGNPQFASLCDSSRSIMCLTITRIYGVEAEL